MIEGEIQEPTKRKPRLGYVIERGLFGYIVRTELDWFPAKDWDDAIRIRDREQKRFEEECAAIEAERATRQEPK